MRGLNRSLLKGPSAIPRAQEVVIMSRWMVCLALLATVVSAGPVLTPTPER